MLLGKPARRRRKRIERSSKQLGGIIPLTAALAYHYKRKRKSGVKRRKNAFRIRRRKKFQRGGVIPTSITDVGKDVMKQTYKITENAVLRGKKGNKKARHAFGHLNDGIAESDKAVEKLTRGYVKKNPFCSIQ